MQWCSQPISLMFFMSLEGKIIVLQATPCLEQYCICENKKSKGSLDGRIRTKSGRGVLSVTIRLFFSKSGFTGRNKDGVFFSLMYLCLTKTPDVFGEKQSSMDLGIRHNGLLLQLCRLSAL